MEFLLLPLVLGLEVRANSAEGPVVHLQKEQKGEYAAGSQAPSISGLPGTRGIETNKAMSEDLTIDPTNRKH